MGLCSGAKREFACPANGPTTTGTIMAKIDLRSRGRFAIFGRYEWASVVCRKAQVVQSLCPYIHGVSSLVETLYGIRILARVLGQSPFPRGKICGLRRRLDLNKD